MTLLALVLGSIQFPPGGLAAWQARPLDPSRHDDWPDDALLFGSPPPFATVGELLAAGAALEADGDAAFREWRDGQGLTGIITGEERIIARTWADHRCARRWCPAAGRRRRAAGRRDAGRSDADGASMGLLHEVLADERLASWRSRSTPGWARRSARWAARAYREAAALLVDADRRRAAGAGAGRRLDAAWRCGAGRPDAVRADLTPLARHAADEPALAVALAMATPLARCVAIAVAAHADPIPAAPIARALLAHPSRYVARMALRALATAADDASLDAVLVVVRAHPSEWTVAVDVIARLAHPGTAARLAALLASDEVRFAPQAIAEPDRPARLEAAHRLVQAAGARPDPALAAALLACFDDPAVRWLVPALVPALARQGGPAIEARGQDLQLAAHGMGRALNQDHARRAALLGIADAEDSGGIIRYDDLDLAGLTTLLDEGFIHPHAQQNDAPPTTAFFQFMTAWPEVRASGYAVSPRRPDYRTMIDGISVDFTAMPPPRAAALKAELEALAASATNTELDDDSAHLWWT
jgi:hypothetical protein